MLILRILKSDEEIPTTFAPLNVKLADNEVPPITFDHDAVATGGLLSTDTKQLSSLLEGALFEVAPSDRTLSLFNLNLNLEFVFDGAVAVTVTEFPSVTDVDDTLIDHLL